MVLADKTLVCRDCGQEFSFTAGEQEFYQSRGLLNEPGRCPECRANRKKERGGNLGNAYRHYTTVTCAGCGKEATVSFEPRQGRPVYCRECYSAMKQTEQAWSRK